MSASFATELATFTANVLGKSGPLEEAVASVYRDYASEQTPEYGPREVSLASLRIDGHDLSAVAFNTLRPLFENAREALRVEWAAVNAADGEPEEDWRDLPKVGRQVSLIAFDDTGPDGMGRRHFSLYWGADGYLRGQCFHADPANYTTEPLDVAAGETEMQAACRVLGVVQRNSRAVAA